MNKSSASPKKSGISNKSKGIKRQSTKLSAKDKKLAIAKRTISRQFNSTEISDTEASAQTQIYDKDHPKSLYFAAALFCTRESIFNVELATHLEKKGYKVNVPQRDGCEFSEATSDIMRDYFGNDEKAFSKANAWTIYLLDVGRFLGTADAVIANLDETLDPGVLIEMMIARSMGKPVIGYRSDFRTPFGNIDSWNYGMHFFALFPCDAYVFVPNLLIGNRKHIDNYYNTLTREIDGALKDATAKRKKDPCMVEELTSGYAKFILEAAEKLVEGADNLQNPDHIKRLFRNYLELEPELRRWEPIMRSVTSYE